MAKGNNIVVTPELGTWMEGSVTGALTPGIIVQLDVSETFDSQNLVTWEPFAPGTDGLRSGLLGILCPHIDGQLSTAAYADGDLARVFIPWPGCQLNLIVLDASATWGDVMIGDTGTGKLTATTGTPEAEPVQMLETTSGANSLGHCIWTGY